MLEIKNLSKRYANGIQALQGINLESSPGLFGLLGPNGAGKSTLMKIMATLLEPDMGSIKINDLDLIANKNSARKLLGYLPQEFGLYPTFTAEQLLNYFAKLKGIIDSRKRSELINILLERVNLANERKQRVGEFSGGMRQRLGIAQALIGLPKLIIVDEPTAGLDPEERIRFHNLLAELASEDCVVILSTHIVADVANLCSRMAVIKHGQIVATSSPQQAINQLNNAIWEATIPRENIPALRARYKMLSIQMFEGQTRVRVISKDEQPSSEFRPSTPTLEDYYFSLVN
jgi:ABC-2 type transport system ATP-binding protein